jgi:hypothetical protein
MFRDLVYVASISKVLSVKVVVVHIHIVVMRAQLLITLGVEEENHGEDAISILPAVIQLMLSVVLVLKAQKHID